MLGPALTMALHVFQRLLKQPRHIGDCNKSDRGRTAAQRVRQPDGGILYWLVQFQRPFAEFGLQAA